MTTPPSSAASENEEVPIATESGAVTAESSESRDDGIAELASKATPGDCEESMPSLIEASSSGDDSEDTLVSKPSTSGAASLTALVGESANDGLESAPKGGSGSSPKEEEEGGMLDMFGLGLGDEATEPTTPFPDALPRPDGVELLSPRSPSKYDEPFGPLTSLTSRLGSPMTGVASATPVPSATDEEESQGTPVVKGRSTSGYDVTTPVATSGSSVGVENVDDQKEGVSEDNEGGEDDGAGLSSGTRSASGGGSVTVDGMESLASAVASPNPSESMPPTTTASSEPQFFYVESLDELESHGGLASKEVFEKAVKVLLASDSDRTKPMSRKIQDCLIDIDERLSEAPSDSNLSACDIIEKVRQKHGTFYDKHLDDCLANGTHKFRSKFRATTINVNNDRVAALLTNVNLDGEETWVISPVQEQLWGFLLGFAKNNGLLKDGSFTQSSVTKLVRIMKTLTPHPIGVDERIIRLLLLTEAQNVLKAHAAEQEGSGSNDGGASVVDSGSDEAGPNQGQDETIPVVFNTVAPIPPTITSKEHFELALTLQCEAGVLTNHQPLTKPVYEFVESVSEAYQSTKQASLKAFSHLDDEVAKARATKSASAAAKTEYDDNKSIKNKPAWHGSLRRHIDEYVPQLGLIDGKKVKLLKRQVTKKKKKAMKWYLPLNQTYDALVALAAELGYLKVNRPLDISWSTGFCEALSASDFAFSAKQVVPLLIPGEARKVIMEHSVPVVETETVEEELPMPLPVSTRPRSAIPVEGAAFVVGTVGGALRAASQSYAATEAVAKATEAQAKESGRVQMASLALIGQFMEEQKVARENREEEIRRREARLDEREKTLGEKEAATSKDLCEKVDQLGEKLDQVGEKVGDAKDEIVGAMDDVRDEVVGVADQLDEKLEQVAGDEIIGTLKQMEGTIVGKVDAVADQIEEVSDDLDDVRSDVAVVSSATARVEKKLASNPVNFPLRSIIGVKKEGTIGIVVASSDSYVYFLPKGTNQAKVDQVIDDGGRKRSNGATRKAKTSVTLLSMSQAEFYA